jgi:hypothetical protein
VLCSVRPDPSITALRYLLYWPHRALSSTRYHADRRQSPLSSMRTNGPFLLGAMDDSSMAATSVAILSLLRSRESLTILERGMG